MPDPNPHDMLTRIEILERRVETLEQQNKNTKVLCYWLPGCPDPHRCLKAGKCLGDVG